MIMPTLNLVPVYFNHKNASKYTSVAIASLMLTIILLLMLMTLSSFSIISTNHYHDDVIDDMGSAQNIQNTRNHSHIQAKNSDTDIKFKDSEGIDDLGSVHRYSGNIRNQSGMNAKDSDTSKFNEGEIGAKHKDPLHDDGYDDHKFIVPLLSSHVGDNNQVMEYMGAAVVARSTNRTLCLTPFFSGPAKHQLLLKLNNGG